MNRHGDDGVEDLHGLAALYAVDALASDERAAFEHQLSGCAGCRAEVAAFGEAAAVLAADTALAPPPELRASVLAAVRAAPRGNAARTAENEAPAPASLADRRRRTRRLLVAAAAAVLLPGLVLSGWILGSQSAQREQQQLASAEQERVNALLAAPDVSAQPVDVEGGAATLVFSQALDEGLFIGVGLPEPGAGREYQLWVIEGETPVPDSRFRDGGDGGVWLSGDLSDAAAVALTIEPAGGSQTPTYPLLAVAPVGR